MGDRSDLATPRDEQVRRIVSIHNWLQVEELLHQALALAPRQRAAFLDAACNSNDTLRAELDSLLVVGDELSDEFLSSPLRGVLDRQLGEIASIGELSAGQLFAERFRLARRLGEGGMGQVWLAEQTSPVRRYVALKLIKAGMYDEAVVQRFKSERQSIAIMDHPAIAKVFDAGATPQGQPYLVMEFVPGLPITDYCDQHKLKIRERLELFIHACEGVQHAHQKAIIHRDLKPSNILVAEVDGKPVPRIIDFGLAKAITSDIDQPLQTRFGQFLGTPGYMSPEQVRLDGRDIDTRTDVYSLGVMLYVLLTGLQPFETKRREKPSLEEWLRQLREEEPPNPSAKVGSDPETSTATAGARGTEPKQLVSLLRGDLDWIAMKAIERDRERRYAAPSELAADLRRYLNAEPVLARPGGTGYQVLKFIRRHRVAAGFMGTVAVLSIVTSAAALIAFRQKHEAQFQATQALQAQARLLTQAAAQHLKDLDVVGAQGIILEVLTNPALAQARTPAAVSVFQEIRAADAQLAVLSGHGEIVFSAAYSPDGSHIVTASRDKTARIWDGRTGAQLLVLPGHDRVNSAAYSPDGMRIVTASFDGTARILDARTGAPLVVLAGHGSEIISAGYSPDGTRIVTAGADKTARIWDARTGAQLTVLSGHGDMVYSVVYSPNGARIVTASWDKTARIWDARTGAQLGVLSGHGDRVSSAAYSPDGVRIVTASWDKTARIWDAGTGAQIAVLSGHGDAVASAAYSPDGTRILTASWDKTARIWDGRTGAQLAVLSGHGDIVYSAVYSPDGTRILTASWDKTARIWYTRTDAQLAVLSGHDDRVYSAAYSPDGGRIVTASEDKTARIWDSRTSAQLAVLSGHDDRVYSAAYSPDGSRIVTASNDRTARIWDASTGAQLALLSGHADTVRYAAYSPDGSRIVTASFDKTARIWDARTGAQLTVLSGHGDIVYSAVYSPDGTRIVTASRDKTARIWDARTGAQLTVLSVYGGYVESAAYSPDGRRIVTASYDETAGIWDARTGVLLTVLSGHGDIVFSAAYSPDGSRIVTASRDKTARVWDARTGAQLAVLLGHGDAAASAAYSPNGTRIVTAAADKTARIWDARVPANIAAQIRWDAAAEADLLRNVDRTRLGLPPKTLVKSWPAQGSVCDQAAAAIYDPDRLAPGILRDDILVAIARPACLSQIDKREHFARFDYQMGRTLFAKADWSNARQQLDVAVAKGYRAARVDLADLLLNATAKMLDPVRAVSLYERAWRDGVPIAAFKLGRLYEHGLQLPADTSKAFLWYQKGADAGEPNALARFAERAEVNALTEADGSKRNVLLLEAFARYAAAAQRAHDEDWPDEAWKNWRYRRATLARLLARDGMMQQVADAYSSVLERRPPERTLWQQKAIDPETR